MRRVIYCSDYETNKIMRYGGNIQVYKVKQVKGSGHWGMTVQLLEMNDNSCVTIITRALLWCTTEKFSAISTDSHGSLYVLD